MNPFACTLYNCKSLNSLQTYLLINNKKDFKKLSKKLEEYPNNFFKPFEQNGRELFRCSSYAIVLHKRLIKLFNIEKSVYLKSGVKKQSHITNARYHETSNFFLLIDIRRFYPSITKNKIKRQLVTVYKQSSNVAEFISNLVTAPQKKALGKRALVTGSPLSQYFTYVINKKMFDELNKVSEEENIRFTVYVDDMTFSSKQIIPYKFHIKVFNILKKYGYATHLQGKKKNFRGRIGDKTKITGVQFTKYGFRLLEKHKIKIRDLLKEENTDSNKRSLLGLVNYAIQVNPKYTKFKNKLAKSKKI